MAVPSPSISLSPTTRGKTRRNTARPAPAGTVTIAPQTGRQTEFLASSADIGVYGGSAGGGKSWSLLVEPLRHVRNPDFGGVIFRRTGPEIRNEGGLWDESQNIYPYFGAWARETTLEWFFPSGAKIRFAHLEHEQDKYSWQGAQVAYFGFDELTHYTETQFFYLLSRNRSTSGVRPYVRCGTNPHALSWVKGFLSPWLEGPHEERAKSGELRWFVRDGGEILWVPEDTPHALSVTFVRASVYDNRILLEKNPEYLAWLMAQTPVERARLLEGDWDIVEAGNFFKREWFDDVVDAVPPHCRFVRLWDMAASRPRPRYPDPDWTCGDLLAIDPDNEVYVAEEERLRDTPLAIEHRILETTARDRKRYGEVATVLEEEPGSSGKIVTDSYRRKLAGYTFYAQRSTGDKRERAKPWSAYCQGGHVHLVRGSWNHDWKNEHCAFQTPGVHDDRIDSCSGGYAFLTGVTEGTFF